MSCSYFLCYEDVVGTLMQADGSVQGCDKERVWSIGLWVPVFPGPDTDDIFEWYIFEFPEFLTWFVGFYEAQSC